MYLITTIPKLNEAYYEVLLKEALDELNLIHTIKRLLQKELQACTDPTSTWGFNPDSTENNSDPANCNEWTLVTKRNRMVKSNKQDKRETPVTDRFTKNHYILLAAMSTDAEGTIPVLVNGDASAKGRVKTTNKLTSHKKTTERGESNHKKTSVKINVSKEKVSHKCPKCSKRKRKHKIIIVGDSHTRGLASNLKHNLSNNFDLNGFVKPGADINTITSSITEDAKHLTFNDILVFWGGANDVSKNNSQDGLKSLTKLVKVHSNTNIILMCVPYHHDLPDWSCVNNEVATFNRKLIKLMKPYKHVTVVRIDLDRKFTRQGMHMNNLGKERTALQITNTAANILLKQKKVISLKWTNVQENSMSDGPTEDNISLQDLKVTLSITTNMEASMVHTVHDESIHMKPRISERQKKPPSTKSDNFYGR
jgi:hypothetical protein